VPTVAQVVLTRFNLPSLGAESVVRAQKDWLVDRVALFERYCLPSVRAQAHRDFEWLIYFDPESPDWLMERIREWAPGSFTPVMRESVSHDELLGDIAGLFAARSVHFAEGDLLVTTNLDNDDGLARDFTERIRAAGSSVTRRTAVYLVNGLIRHGSDIYRRTDRDNAFCSVAEPWAGAQTCWVDWHNMLRKQMPVIELEGEPAWLQVVHDKNVSNRVHGTLADPAPYRELMSGLIDDAVAPHLGRRVADGALIAPARRFATAGRRGVKKLAVRVVGRSGLDAIKLRLARLLR
jgi:hypothetical protein